MIHNLQHHYFLLKKHKNLDTSIIFNFFYYIKAIKKLIFIYYIIYKDHYKIEKTHYGDTKNTTKTRKNPDFMRLC